MASYSDIIKKAVMELILRRRKALDTKSPDARSKNMAAIRYKDTKPELYFRKLLFSKGFRYRKNVSYITGHPDMWLSRYRTAVFINGCFWHRHKNCKYASMPKSSIDYWEKKFARNVHRDESVREELVSKGIKCLTVWECTINRMKRSEEYKAKVLDEIEAFLNDDRETYEI